MGNSVQKFPSIVCRTYPDGEMVCHNQTPYVQSKRGRLETRNRWDVGTNLFKGTISTWPFYLAAHMKGTIEPKYTEGNGIVPRLHRSLYDNRVARFIGNRVSPKGLETVSRFGKVTGNAISFTGHYKRLEIDLEALGRVSPLDTSWRQFAAISTDSASSLVNIFTSLSYATGIALCFRNPASRLAYGILLVQTAAVYLGESSTWILNGIATALAEDEHNGKTGEDNMSAVSSAAVDITLGVSTYYKNKFALQEARLAYAAGNVEAANNAMAFYKVDYDNKVKAFRWRVRARHVTGFFMYATEAIRFGVDVYNLHKNYAALDDPNDKVGRKVREKNINSAWRGIFAGAFTTLSIPFMLNYTLAPYQFLCLAISCAIRATQSRYDHADETIAVSA